MVRWIISCIVFSLLLANSSVLLALTLNGFTRFSTILNLNARSAGLVQAVQVEAGQKVAQDDMLVKLDDALQQARLQRAQAVVKSLKPAVIMADMEMQRAQELYDRDSLSQVEMQRAENNLALAEGELEAAQADVSIVRHELAQMLVTAPISGRVLKVFAGAGEYVDPGVADTPLLILVDSRNMLATATLNSEQWDPALQGRKATVTYRGQRIQGMVSRVGLARVEQSTGLPAYEVEVLFTTNKLMPAQMPVTIELSD